ncbi:AraC family transcriptional regulator [Cellulomonas cellasea]|uniref:AraC family transcriptional regulator n=2 Tax=Cellulomonas cellasea TaxID=43670 RepID=A0A0A0BCG3_9CELL|nr:helix-turn-helix domain-containing protein [Cellulomonas cellasea]KGM03569.1 AraC family transcriptional regulator [Cellulomonas cellasea DSM 20118]GEA89216.1 AraC family transcriptional regulator [Cellulomonas cellasea]
MSPQHGVASSEVASTRLRRHRPDGVPVYSWVTRPGRPPIGTLRLQGADVAPSTRVHQHAHDFLVLAYVEEGGGRLRLGETEHEVRAGEVLVVPPGLVLGAGREGFRDAAAWAVFFTPDAVEGRSPGALSSWRSHPLLLPFVGPGSPTVRRLTVPPADRSRFARRFTDLEAELRDEPGARRQGATEAALALLTLLLVDVARLADDPSGRAGWDDPMLAAVFEVLARRYAEPLALRDVAAEVGLTPGHVTTAVRRRTGRTVQQWLVEHRMAEARRLLEGSDLLVGTVGARVGYPDPAYFARVFRRAHGMSPDAWRRSGRSGAQERRPG